MKEEPGGGGGEHLHCECWIHNQSPSLGAFLTPRSSYPSYQISCLMPTLNPRPTPTNLTEHNNADKTEANFFY